MSMYAITVFDSCTNLCLQVSQQTLEAGVMPWEMYHQECIYFCALLKIFKIGD